MKKKRLFSKKFIKYIFIKKNNKIRIVEMKSIMVKQRIEAEQIREQLRQMGQKGFCFIIPSEYNRIKKFSTSFFSFFPLSFSFFVSIPCFNTFKFNLNYIISYLISFLL